jgi:TonB family protein
MTKPGDKIGPYTVISKLGSGAFGVVWLSEKRTAITATKFALKLPSAEVFDQEAVKQEALLWEQASGHPNILSIIEADVYDNQVVIVSEYAPDGSLASFLENKPHGALSVETAVEITMGILAGLQHLHSRRIIHRDLKPHNIMLQGQIPRIADFGIARVLKTDKSKTAPTGTLLYMAPESFSGKRSELTDIWATGVILYELLTGCHPFQGEDPPSLMYAILTQDPKPLPSTLPEAVRKVTLQALEKDTSKRFQSALEMREALRIGSKSLSYNDERSATATELSKTESSPLPPTTPMYFQKTITSVMPLLSPLSPAISGSNRPRDDEKPIRQQIRRVSSTVIGIIIAAVISITVIAAVLIGRNMPAQKSQSEDQSRQVSSTSIPKTEQEIAPTPTLPSAAQEKASQSKTKTPEPTIASESAPITGGKSTERTTGVGADAVSPKSVGDNGIDYTKTFNEHDVSEKVRVFSKPQPEYTEEARKNKITGTVILKAVFSRSGEVTSVRPVSSLPNGLTERAIAAAKQIKFSPAVKDGHAVSQLVQLEYNFNLY